MEPETKSEATPEATPETKSKSDKRWIIIPTAIVAAAAVAIAVIVTNQKPAEDTGPRIGYAEGAVAVTADDLQRLVDGLTTGGGIVTEYKNNANSTDGKNFTCYVGNSPLNEYDMYIQIFADEALTDQLFLSQLLRPGTVFEEITLDHSLERGTHQVYAVFTQVGEDQSTLVGQVVVTMNFNVS